MVSALERAPTWQVARMSPSRAAKQSNAGIVAQCLDGNQQAWRALIDRYKNLIYSVILKYRVPAEDAADLFQAVCLDLFNELPRIRDADALSAWLIRVASKRCYHWKRRQTVSPDQWDDNTMEEPDADTRPAGEALADLERQQMVREALAELSPRCQEMISLLFFEHPPIPYLDLAERLSLARGSIGFIRGRCLRRLKKILETKGF